MLSAPEHHWPGHFLPSQYHCHIYGHIALDVTLSAAGMNGVFTSRMALLTVCSLTSKQNGQHDDNTMSVYKV